jgi:hypothetical protein
MTVAEIKGEAIVCAWMGGEGDLFRETLPLAVLEAVDVEDPDEEEDDEEEDEEEEEDEDE